MPTDPVGYREREALRADAQLLVTRCVFCRWTYRGTAAECREAARSHRLLKHPEAKRSRRRPHRNSLGMWQQAKMDEESRAEIEVERRARALITGVELDQPLGFLHCYSVWSSLPPEVLALAEAVLTRKQLDVFRLEQNGLGTRAIALHLKVSRGTVQDHLREGHRKLYAQGVRQAESGEWLVVGKL